MLASNTGKNGKRSNEINRDIESLLLNELDDNVRKRLIAEITKEIRISTSKKFFKVLLIVLFLITQVYVIPFLNWNASAVGRILMIKMLKVWDWRYLYNVDCLIERKVRPSHDLNHNTIDVEDDCSFCENIEEIRHDWDVSYSDLKSNYLNRGHPVVLEDHQFLSRHSSLLDYIDSLKNLTHLIDSSPCNLQTSLVTGSHFTSLNALFELTTKSFDGWFLHFRNCDFDAVKASRALEEQPHFLTSRLKPFSSSWILMSNSYKVAKPKKLLVKHVVVVKQIIGSIDVLIAPKMSCRDSCKDHILQLDAGYTVVFSGELWDFFYIPSDEGDAVTFIREYELNV